MDGFTVVRFGSILGQGWDRNDVEAPTLIRDFAMIGSRFLVEEGNQGTSTADEVFEQVMAQARRSRRKTGKGSFAPLLVDIRMTLGVDMSRALAAHFGELGDSLYRVPSPESMDVARRFAAGDTHISIAEAKLLMREFGRLAARS